MKLQVRRHKNGDSYVIQFSLHRVRKCLFLPSRYKLQTAKQLVGVIRECVDAIETERNVDKATWAFLNGMSSDLKERFVRLGIIEDERKFSLKTLLKEYRESICDRAERTVQLTGIILSRYVQFVDVTRRPESISRSEHELIIQRFLSGLALTTQRAYLTTVKQFYNWCVKNEKIAKNPLADFSAGIVRNKEREVYIEKETILKLMETATPKVRALLALYRFGGLRREEALLVRSEDVDLKRRRLTIHSPKTARKGKSSRVIPLFKELVTALSPFLSKKGLLFEDWTASKVTYSFQQLLKQNGVQLWSKLIQNLRSSCSNDIEREYGSVVESEWLGHTRSVAISNYLHTIEEDFRKATDY